MAVSKLNKRYTAFGYTNGTWFQMIGQAEDDPAKVRWGFTHCEPYLRRTFKGTTEALKQVVQDGLRAGGLAGPESFLRLLESLRVRADRRNGLAR